MEVARNPFCSPWPHPWRPPPAGWAVRRGDHGTDQEEGQAEVESARPASEPSGPGLPRNPRREVVNSDERRLKTLAACSPVAPAGSATTLEQVLWLITALSVAPPHTSKSGERTGFENLVCQELLFNNVCP